MKVLGNHVKLQGTDLIAQYSYKHTEVTMQDDKYICQPIEQIYSFKTDTKVPKLGVMLVGWGGNNGTTVTAGLLANKLNMSWYTKRGEQKANYYGSITQSSTLKIGVHQNQEVYLPMKEVLPMVNPDDIVLGGWDISGLDLGEAMKRAQVLEYNLIEQLYPIMKQMKPLQGIYQEDFIAANQGDRVDNVSTTQGKTKQEQLDHLRKDIREFKLQNKVEKVIVLWTANTERFCELQKGVHDCADSLLKAIQADNKEVSPSTLYATAAILEGCSYVNGSPQNTLVPGVIELAKKQDVFIMGDDFKSGQTKIKTVLTDYLVAAGIKPQSIVSYNHLGNNDGKNLSSERQFKSKELSKKSCVDDILASNKILYPNQAKIDHEIIIKYVPFTGDSKKAMDEYAASIFLGGQQTLVLYNVCEDSLLAAPIILDLIILTELFERIQYKTEDMGNFRKFNNVLNTLGYLCKAPLTEEDTPLVNSLFRQKQSLDNIFKACAGLHADDNLLLEFRCPATRRK